MNISISANAVSKGWFGAEAVKASIIAIMIIPTNRLSVNKGDGEPVVAEQLLQLTSDSANLDTLIIVVIVNCDQMAKMHGICGVRNCQI